MQDNQFYFGRVCFLEILIGSKYHEIAKGGFKNHIFEHPIFN
jgi:hypothetical protein